MGEFSELLVIFSEIYFSRDENIILNKIKNKLEENKNLNLSKKLLCLQINIVHLVLNKRFFNILKLLIDYDNKQVTTSVVEKIFYYNYNNLCNFNNSKKNYLITYQIINLYKKNINNKKKYFKVLTILIKKTIVSSNNIYNYKIICNEIYKIIKTKIFKFIKNIKAKPSIKFPIKADQNNNKFNLLINYPSICLPFKRYHKFPNKIQQNLNILYNIKLPYEIINIICDYYINTFLD